MNATGSAQSALAAETSCDRPSWSPGRVVEIACVSLTETGFEIKVIEAAGGTVRQVTRVWSNSMPCLLAPPTPGPAAPCRP